MGQGADVLIFFLCKVQNKHAYGCKLKFVFSDEEEEDQEPEEGGLGAEEENDDVQEITVDEVVDDTVEDPPLTKEQEENTVPSPINERQIQNVLKVKILRVERELM